MTIWTPDLSSHNGPRYLAIAEAIAADARSGALAPGTRLPTHRDLAYRLGVTVGTVSRAYAEAARRGLVVGEVGRGTFVAGLKPRRGEGFIKAAPRAPGIVDFTYATPPVGPAGKRLAATLAEIAALPDLDALVRYHVDTGPTEHMEAGSRWLSGRGLTAPVERVAMTNGAQHGILVTLMSLARPGDVVLAESLTFPGFIQVAQQLGLRIETVAADEGGLIPDAVEEACRRLPVRALYVMPSLQNPTASHLDEDRRRRIADIARRHDVFVIEDDVWSALLDDSIPPVAAFAPDQTFHISGLSKCLAPGLRVAYVLAPEGHADHVRASLRMSTWMSTPLMGEIARRWITDGTADELVRWQRAETLERTALARRLLGSCLGNLGAMTSFVWMPLPPPWRAGAFKAEAEARGVRILTAEAFAAGRDHVPHAARVCVGAPETAAEAARGLEILAEVLGSGPVRGPAVV